jgi:hypothetical protein
VRVALREHAGYIAGHRTETFYRYVLPMNWSEISGILYDFTTNLEKAGTRIETAKKNEQQTYHANHRPWYVKRIRIVRRRFLLLKRRLSKYDSISEILQDLENPLAILFPPETDIEEKHEALTHARDLLDSLVAEIQRKQSEEFDILPRESVTVDPRFCFVMMPFRPHRQFDKVYSKIRAAVRTVGMKCVRSDGVFDSRAIILDIWENIRKSRVCIADISDRNPNVFYELGMTHALLLKRTVLISRELKKDEKPVFDVNYVRCIFYKNTTPGLRRLERTLVRTLRTALR